MDAGTPKRLAPASPNRYCSSPSETKGLGPGLDDVGLIADPVKQRLASGIVEVGQIR
jgi:hypothetical protein